MAPRQKTPAQIAKARSTAAKNAAKTRARINPLTGQEPNTFTQSTNRELPAPTNVRPFDGNGRERSRMQALHREATKPGGVVDAQVGYRKPEGMADRDFAWVTGAHHMLPNVAAERGEPAINEPHEAHPGVTVQRRAEDLSGNEYRKGLAVLAHYGHDSKDPMGSLVDTHRRTLHRVIAEHAQAGVEESSSQLFYGGPVNTEIPDPLHDAAHTQGVMEAHQRFRTGIQGLAMHPDFVSKTPNLSHRERMQAATSVMAQATADTSPNAKWRDSNDRWPNIEQAEESARAGVTGDEPKFITGRIQNIHKAAGRTAEMVQTSQFETHQFGDAKDAAKTVAFRGALTDRDNADAFKVSDVHEASVITPGLPTAKGKRYLDREGNKVTVHADAPTSASKGLQPIMEATNRGGYKNGLKHKVGLSRPEEMLAKGSSLVHTLNDRASREVLANHGLSRGVNYADNVHAMQAAAWGSQQMVRHDVNVSHAHQYPVVRDWGREGINVPHGEDVLGSLRSGAVHTDLGPQFRTNPNTTAMSKSPETAHLVNPTKSKPYPVMPGD